MRKKVFISLVPVLLLLPVLSHSQTINGLWQENSPYGTAGYQACYYFESNKFEYRISEYENMNPIKAFGGTYQIKNDSIYFSVCYYKSIPIIGFEKDPILNTTNGGWEIRDSNDYSYESTLKTVFLEKEWDSVAAIKIFNNYCFWIDEDIYYHIKKE